MIKELIREQEEAVSMLERLLQEPAAQKREQEAPTVRAMRGLSFEVDE